MLSQVASQFPMIWLTCLALLIFLGVFLGVVAWVFRRGSTELYQHLADTPFSGEPTKGVPLR